MNSLILAAEIVQEPPEMIVKFEGLRDGDPPAILKVTGLEVAYQKYRPGDRVLIEGRLGVQELLAQRIFRVPHAVAPSQGNSCEFDLNPF